MLHQPIVLPSAETAPQVRQRRIYTFLFLLVCAIFLYWDVARSPIVLWDKSRNIVSALEMHRTGLGLVTTYGFRPDLWNTKPPLLIWLIFGSVSLFGPSVWALRVPSMVASLGTLLLTFKAANRATGSARAGYAAAAMLLLSPCFYSIHGARTADYDALLTFCTTGYLFALYSLIGQRSPKVTSVSVAGLTIAAAVLTKSIAGLIPLSGVGLYLVATGRLGRITFSPRHWVIALCAIAPPLLFYVVREAESPGYLLAAARNDVLGRFSTAVIGHDEPFGYYAELLMFGWFFLGPLLLVLPFGWSNCGLKGRAMARYCLCVSIPPFWPTASLQPSFSITCFRCTRRWRSPPQFFSFRQVGKSEIRLPGLLHERRWPQRASRRWYFSAFETWAGASKPSRLFRYFRAAITAICSKQFTIVDFPGPASSTPASLTTEFGTTIRCSGPINCCGSCAVSTPLVQAPVRLSQAVTQEWSLLCRDQLWCGSRAAKLCRVPEAA